LSGPSILNSRGEVQPRLLDQRLREIEQNLQRQQPRAAATAVSPPPNFSEIARQLQSSGVAPLQVDQLLGVLAQPQIPYVPTGTAVPNVNDPQSQDGALFRLSTTNTLYRFAANPPPGSWVALAGGTVTSVALVVPTPLTVSGSPVTSAGTITLAEASLSYARALAADTTPVTANANVTTDQNLQAYTVLAGTFNVLTKTIRVFAAGNYTTQAGETPNVRLRLFLGGVQILSWNSNATTASATDMAWEIDAVITVSATGAAGTVEAHGRACVTLGTTGGAAAETYEDVIVAASGAIDLTANAVLQVTGRFSTQPGAAPRNSITERMLIVERLN